MAILSLLVLLTTSACFELGKKRIDAQGFSGEDTEEKAVKNAAAWISTQIANAGIRGFNDLPFDLNYAGENRIVASLVQVLKTNPTLYYDIQNLLKGLMRDPRFATTMQTTAISVANNSGATDLGSFANGAITMNRERVREVMGDIRVLLFGVFRQYLRTFGFGAESATVSFPGISFPGSLQGLTNGQVIDYLATETILQSRDYLIEGTPDPETTNWETRFFSEFNGATQTPYPALAAPFIFGGLYEKDGLAQPLDIGFGYRIRLLKTAVQPPLSANVRLRATVILYPIVNGSSVYSRVSIREQFTGDPSVYDESIPTENYNVTFWRAQSSASGKSTVTYSTRAFPSTTGSAGEGYILPCEGTMEVDTPATANLSLELKLQAVEEQFALTANGKKICDVSLGNRISTAGSITIDGMRTAFESNGD